MLDAAVAAEWQTGLGDQVLLSGLFGPIRALSIRTASILRPQAAESFVCGLQDAERRRAAYVPMAIARFTPSTDCQ